MNSNSQNRLIQMLADQHICKDYKRAFGEMTGLPLTLSPVEHWQLALHYRKHENPFCAMVVQFNKTRTQQQAFDDPKTSEPHTVKGFGGLCETSVPLRLGENLIGFLKTGGVLFNPPTERRFALAVRQLADRGFEADLKKLKTAYFQTPTMSKKSMKAW